MEKFGANGFPTMIAVDASGKELDRHVGFSGLDRTVGWFLELPDRAVPLDAFVARAKAEPKDARVQLVAAKRLTAVGRPADARAFYRRAESGDARIAASAAWDLGRLEVTEGQAAAQRKLAEKIVSKYPTSDEAGQALRFLVTQPKPPVAMLETAIEKRLPSLMDNAPALNALAYVALRGGALRSAEKVALRLEALSEKDANQLDTVAEVFHMRGDTARAISVEEKAIAMTPAARSGPLRANLERFKRGTKEPGPDILAVTAPSMDLEKPAVSPPRPPPPPAVKAERALRAKILDQCGATGDAEPLRAIVITAERPADHRVALRSGTPQALADCTLKAVRLVEVQGGLTITLSIALPQKAFDEALKAAEDKVKADCGRLAESLKLSAVEGALGWKAGGRPSVVIASSSKELAACIETAFAGLRVPFGTLRPLRLELGKKPVVEAGH